MPTIRRLILNPTLAVGEAYMDGGLMPDERGIYDVLDVLVLNLRPTPRAIRSLACARHSAG